MPEKRPIQIKVCGITNVHDAIAAVEAGATMLGLIFVPASARKVTLEEAKRIAQAVPKTVPLVGVFQNDSAAYMKHLKKEIGLRFVQCHGSESPDMCQELNPAIKAIVLAPEEGLELVSKFNDAVELILFDRPKTAPGDDWLSRCLDLLTDKLEPTTPPFLIAGGLNAENVHDVVIRLATLEQFYGVDVASGVEQQPGKKDVAKLRDFCRAVQEGVSHAIVR